MPASPRSDTDAFTERFEQALGKLPFPRSGQARWLVAFSGGLDSTLLLHCLHRLQARGSLVAVHLDHGIHADSPEWTAHCAAVARSLDIEFQSHRLNIGRDTGESLEAIAREARYRVLAELANTDDVVLTAHHADDQLETVMLRLMRGAGVRGMTAIHACTQFSDAWLVRPLLDFTRAEIEAEARRRELDWLEDPSNRELQFDRNFLRAECLPRLRERWPAAGRMATRLAQQMAEAEAILEEVAAADLAPAADPARIPLASLASLSESRLNNALRHAVRSLGLPVPNAAQLGEIRRMLGARADAEAAVNWPGAEARLYRAHLYLMQPALTAAVPQSEGSLAQGQPMQLAQGELRLLPTDEYGIPDSWARSGLTVRYRSGGERFRPHRHRQQKSLKQWFQDSGIVPWMRSSVPLLYHDDRLIAVGDICLADDLPQAATDGPFWRPEWTGHAPLH